MDSSPKPQLTRQQKAVLRLLCQGLTEREAARRLHYSYEYVRELGAGAARQLGARNTRAACYRAGLLRLF